ncbi:hypothetical protein ACHAW6_005378 [Cyclotella cf. meneghiniana]
MSLCSSRLVGTSKAQWTKVSLYCLWMSLVWIAILMQTLQVCIIMMILKILTVSIAVSRPSFLVTVSNYPVLWKSQLQTEIALSTMEAE